MRRISEEKKRDPSESVTTGAQAYFSKYSLSLDCVDPPPSEREAKVFDRMRLFDLKRKIQAPIC